MSAWAGVTTPPIVCMASCCTTPSTGAVRFCRLVRCSALMMSWPRPAIFCSALERSSNRPRSYSATVLSRVSARAAIAELGLAEPAFLHQDLLLLAEQILQFGQVDELRAQFLVEHVLADLDPLLQRRDDRLELLDRCPDGGALGFLLGNLPVDGGKLGILFGGLAEQETAMHLDQRRRRIRRRLERRSRVVLRRQRCTQPGDVELSGDQVAPEMSELRAGHGRIELDQHVARLDGLAVADMDRPHDAGLERLDDLGAAAGNDLAWRHRDDVDRADARPGQRNREYGDDGESDGAPGWRRRRLDDLQRRGQKRQLVLSPLRAVGREGHDIPSEFHASLPGAGRALHNGRRS